MYFVGLCESEKHREIDKKDRQKMKKERETQRVIDLKGEMRKLTAKNRD